MGTGAELQLSCDFGYWQIRVRQKCAGTIYTGKADVVANADTSFLLETPAKMAFAVPSLAG